MDIDFLHNFEGFFRPFYFKLCIDQTGEGGKAVKLKGMVLQIELIIFFLLLIILFAGSMLFKSYVINLERTKRMQEISAIHIALSKYAKNHHGAVPRSTDLANNFSSSTVTIGGKSVDIFLYDKPSLYPKDLYELCELGYLPASFFGELKAYTTSSTGNSITTTYGTEATGQYIYKVTASNKDTERKQYVKYSLSYKGPHNINLLNE